MDLQGKTALVTGAAHRVGREMALALAKEGADIVVHYGTSADDASETAARLEALGVRAETVAADLASPAQIDELFGFVAERFGRLDVLVNNAASFRHRRFDAIAVQDWDHVLSVNLRAAFLCTQRAARLMRAGDARDDGPALVVNLADLSGVLAWRGYAHHAVSKAGLLHLTAVAARELAPDVRVNAIVPGPVLPPPGMAADSDAWRRIGSANLMGRPGTPGDVARAVVFLAESDFVTGNTLMVDGGEHLLGPVNH